MKSFIKSTIRGTLHRFFDRINSSNPFLKTRFSQIETLIRNLDIRVHNLEKRVHEIDYELRAKPFISDEEMLLTFFEENGSKIGFKSVGKKDFSYADFEHLYRGPENFILERMKFYQKFFSQNSKVLDVGCGRGELIRVLKEVGIDAFGIEPDFSMYEIALSQNLIVENLNWKDKFSQLESNCLDGIVMIQVIEHLLPETFNEFFTESHRILKPGGKLILETVNPHSPAALKTFWLDLTHVRPIFPESIMDLAIRTRFSFGYVLFPYGNGVWENDIRNSGEYAAILEK